MSSSPLTAPNLKAIRLYLGYWGQFRLAALFSVLFSLVLALQNIVIPLVVALALGQLIKEHVVNAGLLVFLGVFQLGLVATAYILDSWGVAILHNKVTEKLYEDSFKYLAHQDYSFFADNFSGSIVTQASRFAKVYTIFNDVMFFELFPQLFGVLIALGVMIHYSMPLGILVFMSWLLSIVVIVKFALNRLPLRRSAVAKESEQVGELADVITNALTVKTFAAEDREIKRYSTTNILRGTLFLNSWRRAVRNGWIIETACAALQLLVVIGAILAVKNGSIGIATFLLFQVYVLRIIDNIRRSSFMVRQLEAVAGDGQEMAELLEQAPLVQDQPFAEKSRISEGVIDFDDVTFQYQDASSSREALFEKFNIRIKSGEKVGLVGPSGGGKTTITRLVLRFMDIQAGNITIDGQDIRAIKQQDLRSSIAYVPQEPLLFHRSIKDNIRYGKPSATDSEVVAVAKKSFAHDFIKALPHGYDTLVGERGVKLSGGQRQRVAIARAMLKNAPILVLDEATSALDSESERVIQKALWELMKNKTALVIAHRLSTIQRMDRIIVLDEGQVIEEGSHDSLLKQQGLYAKLWSHQSGGFIEKS
jgi:ATP-binding cassette subfamily B protein